MIFHCIALTRVDTSMGPAGSFLPAKMHQIIKTQLLLRSRCQVFHIHSPALH